MRESKIKGGVLTFDLLNNFSVLYEYVGANTFVS